MRKQAIYAALVALLVCAFGTMRAETAETSGAERDRALSRAMGPPFTSYDSVLVPEPKRIAYRDGAVTIMDGDRAAVGFEADFGETGPVAVWLEKQFARRLDAYKGQFGDVAWGAVEAPVSVAFVPADSTRAATALGELAPDGLPPQGYLLDVDDAGIVCVGADAQGFANGLATLLELFHVRDGKLAARKARVFDYPTFAVRYQNDYTLVSDDVLDWMILNKINGLNCGYAYLFDWRGVSDEQKPHLRRAATYVKDYGILHFMPQLHIGPRIDSRPALDCGDPEQIATLCATIDELIALSGARNILLLSDDVKPFLNMPREKERFASLGEAHNHLTREVLAFLREKHPDARLLFCPPPYQGRVQHEARKNRPGYPFDELMRYLEDMRAWDPEAIVVWTGPVTESRWITAEDIDWYLDRIGRDKKLFYWDNTWHYHQPLRNFHARYLEGFEDYNAHREVMVNAMIRTPIGQFFATTANDYYWNPAAFDPERSWRAAVARTMGPDAVSAAADFYALRGDDYNVFFKRSVDLAALERVLLELKRASWTDDIPDLCLEAYEQIVQERAEPAP